MNIAIITGRTNNEREISICSAQAVHEACQQNNHHSQIYDFPNQIDDFLQEYKNINFVFVIIHGKGGEDGKIPAFLDILGLPYQCTNPKVLGITIDKWLTKQIWKQHNIPIAQDHLVNLNDTSPTFQYPCVLKALDQGSSIGVIICHTAESFEQGIHQLQPYGTIMIEELLIGSECTIPILDNKMGGDAHVLPIIEIVPPIGQEFNYTNKYNNLTEEICLARYDQQLIKKIQTIALQAYQALGCTQYGRIDMIITDDGPKCLEINTIPGFTSSSLFPKSAQVFGLSFPQLIQYLIDLKLK